MNGIAPAEIEDMDVTIRLANRDTITPLGIVRDVEVLCGKIKYPTYFLVLGSPQDDFCPIIFGRPFLNMVNAHQKTCHASPRALPPQRPAARIHSKYYQ